MSLLSNLLPGIRELRAPLAAGYLWLLFGWLMIGDLPSREEANGPLKAVLELGDELNPLAIGIVASFAAYVVGSLLEDTGELPLRLRGLVRAGKGSGPATAIADLAPRGDTLSDSLLLQGGGTVSAHGHRAIETLIAEKLDESHFRLTRAKLSFAHLPDETAALALGPQDHFVFAVLSELDLVATRLIGREPELFGEVDRLRAESEFRFAIVPPLCALAVILAVQSSVLWLGAIIPLAVLFRQAVWRRRKAGDRLADALRVGRVDSPALEKLARGTDDAIDQAERGHAPAAGRVRG